ncbi:MAG: hypothetical protein SVT52_00465 [Planctomycetota bacterium]|nr:hypothetical protein [Planctomycetota bacterium]
MNGLAQRVTVLMTACILAAGAEAQVSRTQAGRALDANYQVGSGGYNARTYGGPLNSQLYVTGQVTGLGRFRGGVGYAAGNQLRLSLPSASLGTFHQESVGVQDVLGGGTYAPTPYFERTRTAFGVRGITSGLAAPGTDMPIRSAIPTAMARKLYVDATADYEPVLIRPPGQATSVTGTPLISIPDGSYGATGPQRTVKTAGPVLIRPGAAAAFNVPREEDRRLLVRELAEMQEQDDQPTVEVQAGVDARAYKPAEVSSLDGQPASEKPSALPEPPSAAKTTGGKTSATERGALPQANQDVFLDVLVQLRQVRSGTDVQKKPSAIVAAPEEPKEQDMAASLETLRRPGPADTAAAKPLKGSGDQSLTQPNLVEISPDNTVIIHGLAGRNRNLFNMYLAEGEKLLADGKYYEAADRYQFAVTINSTNPLARIGLALSMFAAGEPISAGMQFRRALVLFPPLMETKLDVKAMLDERVFNHRLAEVDRRLNDRNKSPEAMLAFVSVFLHHSVGNHAEAKRYAHDLVMYAGSDRLIASYATFVLTGKRPGGQKQEAETKPAK